MSFSIMTILKTILFQNKNLKLRRISTYFLMPFSHMMPFNHITNLGRIFLLKVSWCTHPGNVDTLPLHNLVVWSWGQ